MTDGSIGDRIQADMTAAMKSQDKATLSTLRMLKAALLEARTKKPKGEGLSGAEEIEILQSYLKKRRDMVEQMKKLGRDDVVTSEEAEIRVTQRYLPEPLSEDELRAVVREAIASTGAASPKEMGKVIGAVMARVKGRAEGSVVSRLVKEALAG